ncbi:MAG: tRNA (guanosine(37)-N1)-methyltransferase TrmD [Alphaproteobacteria bacterium]|nr:MAG: tRNA (guanosine(37)-N1)-methyltransferase TrmD [Alphaproteobacteria bacterium]
MTFTAQVITLFPEVFPGPLGISVPGRALEAGLWRLRTYQLRDFALDRHRTVDDTPAGGGPGMVIRPDVAARAIDHALAEAQPGIPRVFLTPAGRPFTQELAKKWAAGPGLLLICARFEGMDQRVIEARGLEEVSIGDYVLSGGELPAMVVLDAVVRLLPGVVGKAESTEEESFQEGLLEYPHYTRPRVFEGRAIPEVLLSGHHGEIARWRQQQREERTRLRRPDLWSTYERSRREEENS